MSNDSEFVMGVDLGDLTSHTFCFDKLQQPKPAPKSRKRSKRVGTRGKFAMTRKGALEFFDSHDPCLVVMEAGAQSAWVSRVAEAVGHEVIVANPRRIKTLTEDSRKNDKKDAELLARFGASDNDLLNPIQHRSEKAQHDLSLIRARDTLVRSRVQIANSARGMAKVFGHRLMASGPKWLPLVRKSLPEELKPALCPLLDVIEDLNLQICELEKKFKAVSNNDYPITNRFQKIYGVGPILAAAFVTTIDDPKRFLKSHDIGAFLGLTPKQSQSGKVDKQLGISKEGDRYLRKLLVQSAHILVRDNSPDTDLKRWATDYVQRGGKNAKKRAIVATARKLAIVLHRMWVDDADYRPLRTPKNAA